MIGLFRQCLDKILYFVRVISMIVQLLVTALHETDICVIPLHHCYASFRDATRRPVSIHVPGKRLVLMVSRSLWETISC